MYIYLHTFHVAKLNGIFCVSLSHMSVVVDALAAGRACSVVEIFHNNDRHWCVDIYSPVGCQYCEPGISDHESCTWLHSVFRDPM